MKPVTLMRCKRFFTLLSFMVPFALYAAPSYTFTGAVLESGTDLQVGAVYRFTAVQTGVDALVTITYLTAGCTITIIDNDGTGYPEAFQPEILVPAKTNGYAEFNIQFVATGSSTPMTMIEIPATAVDIDGNNGLWGGPLNEFDEISMGSSSYIDYDLLGGQLSVSTAPGWMKAVNTGGVEYPGISISATAVMVTTVNASASFFNYRTGVNNQSNISSLSRQKSLYFQKFTYPNSVLATADVLSFTGALAQNQVNLLWQLSNNEGRQSVTLEKSTNGHDFTTLHTFAPYEPTDTYAYSDDPGPGKVFYRLSITYSNGNTGSSKVLCFKSTGWQPDVRMEVYPSIIQSAATVRINASMDENGMLYLVNAQGATVFRQALQLNAGSNSLHLTPGTFLPAGVYTAVVSTNGHACIKKLVVQP